MENNNVLIIVESPTKANTIKKFLPKNYNVLASMGHIRILDKSDDAIDCKNNFKPKYVIDSKKKAILSEIKNALKKADFLLLATDEDREGESISWHLVDVLKPREKYNVDYKRMVFHEITEKAIKQALENQRDINMELVKAQEARRLLDRLYGFNVSKLLWKKLSKYNLSAGRVQSPGLRLIVEKEKQRLKYTKTPFNEIKATLLKEDEKFEAILIEYDNKKIATSKSFDLEGKYKEKVNTILLDDEKASNIVNNVKEFKIDTIETKQMITKPPIPFTTSTLQMEANRKLRYSGKQTMNIAQKLYEKGYITYMRTDSPFLSSQGIDAARNKIVESFGNEYLSDKKINFTPKSSNAQEAHEAIRPAGEFFRTADELNLDGQEKTLYQMIYRRTLACQMKPSIKLNTSVKIKSEKGLYLAKGTAIKYSGYLKAYIEGIDEEDEKEKGSLPLLDKEDLLSLDNIEIIAKESKPPYRYSEATLIKELEKLGIGRPSTYATIISTLKDRTYIKEEKNQLIPTFTGFVVSNYLTHHLSHLIDYKFTEKMENDLDSIATGNEDLQNFLTNFYLGENGLEETVKNIRKEKKNQEDKTIKLPQVDESLYKVLFGPISVYVQYTDSNNELKNMNVPKTYYPYTLTNDAIESIINNQFKEVEPIGEKDGKNIYLIEGNYGYFWRLGEKGSSDSISVSVPMKMKIEDLTIDDAIFYLSLPKELGQKDNKPILLNNGKFGAYIKYDNINISIGRTKDPRTFSLQDALILISSKESKIKNKDLDINLYEFEKEHFKIKQGPYGIYLKYGKINLALPKEYKTSVDAAKKIPLDEAIKLLENKKKSPKKFKKR